MIKILGGVVIGVFVGAFAVELLRRTRPELIDDIERKARDTVDSILSAYESARSSAVHRTSRDILGT